MRMGKEQGFSLIFSFVVLFNGLCVWYNGNTVGEIAKRIGRENHYG